MPGVPGMPGMNPMMAGGMNPMMMQQMMQTMMKGGMGGKPGMNPAMMNPMMMQQQMMMGGKPGMNPMMGGNPMMMNGMGKGMNPMMMNGGMNMNMMGNGKGGPPIMPPGGMANPMAMAGVPMGAGGMGGKDFAKNMPSVKGMQQSNLGYVVLHHMFDLKEAIAEGPGYWKDLEEDIVDECKKYGPVEHCKIARNSAQQSVYLKFADDNGAEGCMQELHGRLFAGKSVVAEKTTQMEHFNAM